jgi:hypothetical protein
VHLAELAVSIAKAGTAAETAGPGAPRGGGLGKDRDE